MSATESPAKPDNPKPVLSRADRATFNEGLRKDGHHEHFGAILYPAVRRGEKVSSPRLIIEKLPRTSAGRPPRRGVYIPLPAIARVRLVRAGKHSRQKAQPWSWERAAKVQRKEEA